MSISSNKNGSISLQVPTFPVGLIAKLNAGTPAKQVDVAWTQLLIQDTVSTSFSKTMILPATGASGGDLDTGVVTDNTWYYVWAISKLDGTTTTIFSASSTNPTLPTGYVKKKFIFPVRHASAAFVAFVLQDKSWKYVTSPAAYSYTGATPPTSNNNIDCSQFIPLLVNTIYCIVYITGHKTGAYMDVNVELTGCVNGIYMRQSLSEATASTVSVDATITAQCIVNTYNCYIGFNYVGVGSPTIITESLAITGFDIPL